jgi:hypothetical protein
MFNLIRQSITSFENNLNERSHIASTMRPDGRGLVEELKDFRDCTQEGV